MRSMVTSAVNGFDGGVEDDGVTLWVNQSVADHKKCLLNLMQMGVVVRVSEVE